MAHGQRLTKMLPSGILLTIVSLHIMPTRHHISRKGARTLWKEDRKVAEARRRKQKAKRMAKAEKAA